MRLGGAQNKFDLSDVEVQLDSLDTVLDIAGEVLYENAPEPGSTRIERMARWLALNVGTPIPFQSTGACHKFTTGDVFSKTRFVDVLVVGDMIGLCVGGIHAAKISKQEAREIATALLRAVEFSEAR